jgi:hypothetical protein
MLYLIIAIILVWILGGVSVIGAVGEESGGISEGDLVESRWKRWGIFLLILVIWPWAGIKNLPSIYAILTIPKQKPWNPNSKN